MAMKKPMWRKRLTSASARDFLVVGLPTLLVVAAAIGVGVKARRFAPPGTIRLASGPAGSGYRSQAEKYRTVLARYGVKVELIPSKGALDNLEQLADRTVKVDVGFVQGGLAEGREFPGLVSLGSLYPQPVMVYCRTAQPIDLLTVLKG
jgi:TRAP-type uncharacterized transport system substrate-binding protein